MSTLPLRPAALGAPRDAPRDAGPPVPVPSLHAERWIAVGHTGGWQAVAARGAVALTVGVCALAWPEPSLALLLAALAGYATVTGVSALVAARRMRRLGGAVGPLVAYAAVTLAGAVALVRWPTPTATIVVTLFAAWMVLSGLSELALAVRLHDDVSHAWVLGAIGVVSLLFALVLLATPRDAPRLAVVLLGLYGVLSAAFLFGLAIGMRRAGR